MRKTIIVIASVIFVIALAYAWSHKRAEAPSTGEGSRDAHGCLLSDGYSFDADVGACLREVDMTADIKKAAKIALIYADESYGRTIVSFNSYEEPGAYDIVLEDIGGARQLVYVRNWRVVLHP